jgi:hypothetical protein
MADHDHGYKLVFSHPEVVRDLLQGAGRGLEDHGNDALRARPQGALRFSGFVPGDPREGRVSNSEHHDGGEIVPSSADHGGDTP